MGTYATTTTLQTVLIGYTFDTATTNLASQCITWAEAEVDKHLSRRYDLSDAIFQTSTSVPPIVRTNTEWLAESYFHDANSRGGVESHTRDKILKDRAEMNLKLIADYEANLLDSLGAEIADNANGEYQVKTNTSDYSNTFNEDDPLLWKVDSDKLDDIRDERDS